MSTNLNEFATQSNNSIHSHNQTRHLQLELQRKLLEINENNISETTTTSSSLSNSLGNLNNIGSNSDDQQAMQLAFELSMLGLQGGIDMRTLDALLPPITEQYQTSPLNSPCDNTIMPNNGSLPFVQIATSFLPSLEDRSKKSQNMTECVPVPSSEHVAEIVGRQGCKIKALRAKTNTYIKTPVRGEEPVFVVTGRKEDVNKAKMEILSAAEHFSLIRASRKPAVSGIGGKGTPSGPPAIPGQITSQVRVPYRVVGLVVGPKGATIKYIQQQTDTYIVTPSRDKEPVFEVTGQPINVKIAEMKIKAHIEYRTGQVQQALEQNGIGGLLCDETESDILASLCKNGLGSILGYLESGAKGNNINNNISSNCSTASSTSSKGTAITRPELVSIWKTLSGENNDVDEGLGESPNIWSMATPSLLGSRSSPSASASPTDSLLGGQTSKRECLVCGDKKVTSALVPCGHNLFCLECANRICLSGEAICPACSQTVIQAIRIIG